MKAVVAMLALAPALAAAHPLGNFSINRYAALGVERAAITVHYVVDMAELPALAELRRIDDDGDGKTAPGERDGYLEVTARELGYGLVLAVDGTRIPLIAAARELAIQPGAGGLSTLRLDLTYTAGLATERGQVTFTDENFAGRSGWQEVIARAAGGIALTDASVPATDRSQALRAYPDDLLTAPPQVREARFDFAPGGSAADAATAPAAGRMRTSDRLTELIAVDRPLSAGLVVTSLLMAAALGALHALGPGHGKTIVGAYLVGARGTARHALLLGLVVTATHTAGVYLLGLATLAASHWIVPERLLPWLSVGSGLIVIAIGTSLMTSRLHQHHHHHHHHHDAGHHHLVPESLDLRSLVALGVSGGLLPCPSALVVMLGAIALGRIAFGLGLIVAFSAGLAAVLTSVGLVLVYARHLFDRLPMDGRFARVVPVASALVISAAGVAIVARALAGMGA
jgi:ABC-type nickel/cobalt efflux system permease component RcnA